MSVHTHLAGLLRDSAELRDLCWASRFLVTRRHARGALADMARLHSEQVDALSARAGDRVEVSHGPDESTMGASADPPSRIPALRAGSRAEIRGLILSREAALLERYRAALETLAQPQRPPDPLGRHAVKLRSAYQRLANVVPFE